MYSTLIRKKCKCSDCVANPSKAKWPTFSCYGYNYSHLPVHLQAKAGTRQKVAKKNKNKRLAIARQLHADQREADGHTWQVELFFHAAALELSKNPYCQECGEWIPSNLFRAATAHILPKRKEYGFPSVAAHPKNRLFLCGINGCHDKTHTWSTFQKMKVWPLAVEAFKEIYPYIDSSEVHHLPNILLETLLESNTEEKLTNVS